MTLSLSDSPWFRPHELSDTNTEWNKINKRVILNPTTRPSNLQLLVVTCLHLTWPRRINLTSSDLFSVPKSWNNVYLEKLWWENELIPLMQWKNNEAVTSFSIRSGDAIEAALSGFAYIYAAPHARPLNRPLPRLSVRSPSYQRDERHYAITPRKVTEEVYW